MRADIYIYTSGNAKSRQNAKVLIEAGNVLIDGKKITKPAFEIDELAEHNVEIINKSKFVSRGGEKLDFALEKFNIDVTNLTCIDIGASTGGFTDCLLQRGARRVYAVDSGHSQLDINIENDERVVSIEKFNAKFMTHDDFDVQFDIAVMDVSFISQTLIHSGICDVLKDDGILVSLIKPQFECGKNALNSHGIVKKASFHSQAICKVIDNALISGFSCIDITRSPIEGGSGNVEFLAYFKKSAVAQNLVNENKIKTISQAK
jgi:23S rRNA (cytidine1920-2'-O)/16S rRNA (cytidine1409-2'-O)-methyltransferase